MSYSSNDYVGYPQVELYVPDTVQRASLGQTFEGVDPFFGWGKFIYGKAGAAITQPGRLCTFDYQYTSSDLANTGNTGSPFFVNRAPFPIGSFGWFQMSGLCPMQAAQSVAIGAPIGIGGAGQGGTNGAGKQLLGVRVVQPSSFAPTMNNCFTQVGSNILTVPNCNGLFVGNFVTGTGIPGSTNITAIDPGQNRVTLSNSATVTGSAVMTFPWTGFVMAWINNSFVQGAIT